MLPIKIVTLGYHSSTTIFLTSQYTKISHVDDISLYPMIAIKGQKSNPIVVVVVFRFFVGCAVVHIRLVSPRFLIIAPLYQPYLLGRVMVGFPSNPIKPQICWFPGSTNSPFSTPITGLGPPGITRIRLCPGFPSLQDTRDGGVSEHS